MLNFRQLPGVSATGGGFPPAAPGRPRMIRGSVCDEGLYQTLPSLKRLFSHCDNARELPSTDLFCPVVACAACLDNNYTGGVLICDYDAGLGGNDIKRAPLFG